MASASRFESAVTCAVSCSSSSRATRHAAPKPTQSECGSVPERSPRSWPPPERIGVSRTRGRRRT